MRIPWTKLYLVFFTLVSLQAKGRPIIYGEDNRAEHYEIEGKIFIEKAFRSIALVLSPEEIEATASKRYREIKTESFGKSMELCPSERFYEQPTAGFCTGFLVKPDVLATAGHCLPQKNSCEDLSFLFDFKEKAHESRAGAFRTPSKNLYSCKEILFFSDNEEGSPHLDLALIRLDRKAQGRSPLPLARHPFLPSNSALSLLGHPSGLPLKVAPIEAILDNTQEEYFSLAVDSYTGNSGSPLVNESTGEVEGMLIRGHEDFTWNGECYVSAHCDEFSCRGEDALRSEKIQKILTTLL